MKKQESELYQDTKSHTICFIFSFFNSKENIIIGLLEYLAKNSDKRYAEAISKEQGAEEKFKALFQNQYSFFNENPHFVVVVFSDGLMAESLRINAAILAEPCLTISVSKASAAVILVASNVSHSHGFL